MCVACTPGNYCPEGTGVPLPCEEGTYSNRTGLVDASQCTKTAPGYYAPVGSTENVPCPPGSYDENGGKGRCELCKAGKYTHPNPTRTLAVTPTLTPTRAQP